MVAGDMVTRSDDSKANILIVDDNVKNLTALEAVLSQLDVNLVKAASGEAALRCLLDQEFAVILLDVMMPGMDGYETARLIRERERFKHTPLFFLTAINKSQECIEKGYTVGAVDYIFKPINPDILTAKVKLFVELFELKHQERHEAQEAHTLYEELSREEDPSCERPTAWPNPSIDQHMDELVPVYGQIVTAYVGAIRTGANRPTGRVHDFVRLLASLRVRARDVVRLHITVLAELEPSTPPSKRLVLGNDTRLVLAEVLGKLVDVYLAASLGDGRGDWPA